MNDTMATIQIIRRCGGNDPRSNEPNPTGHIAGHASWIVPIKQHESKHATNGKGTCPECDEGHGPHTGGMFVRTGSFLAHGSAQLGGV